MIEDSLMDLANLTVFAPTDDAFMNLPNGTLGYLMLNNTKSSDDLRNILLNHVVQNDTIFYSFAIQNGTTELPTLDMDYITIRKGGEMITVDGANVDVPNVLAANGVIHGIDQVLVPSNVKISVADVLEGYGTFTTLLYLLKTTNILMNLTYNPAVTIFAPDDEAFDRVQDLNDLEANSSRLYEVLSQHIAFYESIDMLNVSAQIAVGDVNTTNSKLIVVTAPNQVELETPEGMQLGSAMVIGSSKGLNGNGYIYVLDTVLGVAQESESSGLKTWQIVLIVVGGVVVGLLLLIVVAAIVYVVFFRQKTGYRKIN